MNDSLTSRLRPAILGLTLALLTLIFGQAMGIAFGLNEESIKSRLYTSAVEVRESIYQNDDAAIKVVLDKSWTYMKRAHLHAGGMGTTAVCLIILLCLLPVSARMITVVSIGIGAGSLGYALFWMWAGFRAPALGGTGAAKESLGWLAMPSSGAFVAATVAVALLAILSLRDRR